jgi:hypothetical protein
MKDCIHAARLVIDDVESVEPRDFVPCGSAYVLALPVGKQSRAVLPTARLECIFTALVGFGAGASGYSAAKASRNMA